MDRLDEEILRSYVTSKPREYFIAHPEYHLTLLERFRFKLAKQKRQCGIPIAYITGHKEFYGLDFIVDKHTLVPRPETETLVEAVIKHVEMGHAPSLQYMMIDVGTGTGCIPIAVMKASKHKNIKTFAIDISRGALRVAKKNAKRHGVDITFLHGNLLSPIVNNRTIEQCNNRSIILTANLPYLTQTQFDEEPSIQHEPHSALVAAENGLALYKQLLQQLAHLPTCQLVCFFEIDPSQSTRMRTLVHEILPNAHIEIKKDLSGQDRVVVITAPST